MPSLTSRMPVVVAALLVAACSSARPRAEVFAPPHIDELTGLDRVTHVLSRLTFGARAGDAERVAALGVDRWIDQQLKPETIPDSAVTVALSPIPIWSQSPSSPSAMEELAESLAKRPMSSLMNDTAARASLQRMAMQLKMVTATPDYLVAGRIIRAQVSERQLLEVIADFWENHFSMYSGKMPSRGCAGRLGPRRDSRPCARKIPRAARRRRRTAPRCCSTSTTSLSTSEAR